jgi:hypothetical protein
LRRLPAAFVSGCAGWCRSGAPSSSGVLGAWRLVVACASGSGGVPVSAGVVGGGGDVVRGSPEEWVGCVPVRSRNERRVRRAFPVPSVGWNAVLGVINRPQGYTGLPRVQ